MDASSSTSTGRRREGSGGAGFSTSTYNLSDLYFGPPTPKWRSFRSTRGSRFGLQRCSFRPLQSHRSSSSSNASISYRQRPHTVTLHRRTNVDARVSPFGPPSSLRMAPARGRNRRVDLEVDRPRRPVVTRWWTWRLTCLEMQCNDMTPC